ncbi:hypothetical protein LLG96_04865 [bacterium]|nr:hypothetical protein [bacterium]
MIRFFLRIALYLVSGLVCVSHGFTQETTWESPPVATQIDMDDTIVPVGKGAVFCPSMTNSDNEPVYGVLRDGHRVEEAPTGHRIPLEPGVYKVVYGSGTLDQMMSKTVKVVEGSTSVLKVDWSGLVIDVINESRTKVREYYELIDLSTGDSYGIGQGIEQGLDEKLRTWILPPGRYKIVKPGGNINDVINFGTIRLAPGELTYAILVVDSNTFNFLGFGYRSDVRQLGGYKKKWTKLSELAGNALLNYIPSSESGTESGGSFTSTVQWLTDARYESGNHIIPIWSNLEEGLSMQNDKVLRKYTDKAELKVTYIYRFTNLLSPYVRGAAETRFFATSVHFDKPTSFAEVSAKGDTVRVENDADKVKLGGPFSPIYLKQGFGINSILIKTLPVNFNLRGGYGARQTLARKAYIYNSDTKVLSPIQKTDVTGAEFLLLGDIRLGRYILFDTELDILMPSRKTDSWVFDGENRLRLSLTSNVSLLFTAEFWKNESVLKTQTRYQLLLRFSKFL